MQKTFMHITTENKDQNNMENNNRNLADAQIIYIQIRSEMFSCFEMNDR